MAKFFLAFLIGLTTLAKSAIAQDDLVFLGSSPAVSNSGASPSFKKDVANEKVFSWISFDPILGAINTLGFVSAATWNFLPGSPDRLIFTGSGGGATFYGNVLFDPYNRAVVDVVKGGQRVRYVVVKLPTPCDQQLLLLDPTSLGLDPAQEDPIMAPTDDSHTEYSSYVIQRPLTSTTIVGVVLPADGSYTISPRASQVPDPS